MCGVPVPFIFTAEFVRIERGELGRDATRERQYGETH